MSEFITNLGPYGAILLGATWLVREILGFVKGLVKDLRSDREDDGVQVLLLKQISGKLDKIDDLNTNIKLHTNKLQEISNKLSHHRTSS